MKSIVIILLILLLIAPVSYAGNKETSVNESIATRCAKIYEDPEQKTYCIDMEKEAYEKMQGDFGMSPEAVRMQKDWCTKMRSGSYQSQVDCMEEKRAIGQENIERTHGEGEVEGYH